MTKKNFLMVSLCIILIAGCGRNDEISTEKETMLEPSTRQSNSVVGKWYRYEDWDEISIWSFDDEGKFYHISEEDYGDDSIIFTSDKYVALESNEKYWTSNTYYETIKDKNGYVIEKDKLVKYFTNSNEILLPDTVNEIGKSVIVSELENIEKITIVGEIKKIGASAFCETSVDIFVIEEGVEEIGDYAFSDSYFYEIHIPNSVIKIGKKAFNCSEGNEESKIYVKKGSYAEKYFAENEGVYDGDVIVEE